jgi:hypothetical protein
VRDALIREWCGYTFNWVCEIVPDKDANGKILEDTPQEQYAKAATSRLHAYGHGAFCRFRIRTTKPEPGVYIINIEDRAMYVGECTDLSSSGRRSRFNAGYGRISPRNCYEGGQQTNCRINTLILESAQQGRRLELWFMPSGERKLVEQRLLRQLQPPWNRR